MRGLTTRRCSRLSSPSHRSDGPWAAKMRGMIRGGGDEGRCKVRWGMSLVRTAAWAKYRSASSFFSSHFSSCRRSSVRCLLISAMRRYCALRVWTSAITPLSPNWKRVSSMMSLFGVEGWSGARSVSHQQKFKTQVRNIREGSLYITNARSLLLYKSLQGLLRNAIVLPI